MASKKWKISFTNNGSHQTHVAEADFDLDDKHAAIIIRNEFFPQLILIDLPNSNKMASKALLEKNGVFITGIECL